MRGKLFSFLTVILFFSVVFCMQTIYADDNPVSYNGVINEAQGITLSWSEDAPTIDTDIKLVLESGTIEDDARIKWYVDDEYQVETGFDDVFNLTEENYETWIRADVYSDSVMVATKSLYFSKLPVIYIDTEEAREITSKTEYLSAKMNVQGNELFSGNDLYSGDIEIKGRGNTTWSMPKKPYKIKLDKKSNLLKLGKNKHFVLLANYLDESLMRNKIAYDMSKELGLVSMDSTWADVVLNGQYIGNYQVCEQIRIDEGRVDIFDWEDKAEDIADQIAQNNGLSKNDKKALKEAMKTDFSWISEGGVVYNEQFYSVPNWSSQDITGGYLFELSVEYDELSKFTTSHGTRVMIKSPEYLYTNTEMMNYVKDYWEYYEAAIMSDDGYDGNVHYTELADFSSMLAYWLTMEITGNNDAVWKSRYAYKGRNEKLYFGPAWDFDWGFGSSMVGNNPEGWKVTPYDGPDNFYKEWTDDPYFCKKLREIYLSKRPYFESIVADRGLIDQYAAYLDESGRSNENMWKYSRGFSGETGDVSQLKRYLTRRLNWLDQQFASTDTLVESVSNSYSAHPFVKNGDILITDSNLIEGVSEGNVFARNSESTVSMNILVRETGAEKLELCINGLKYRDFNVDGDTAELRFPQSELSEDENCIVLLARDATNNVIARNYILAKKADKDTRCIMYVSQPENITVKKHYAVGEEILNIYAPQRTGFTLEGWYIDPELTSKYEFGTMPDEDLVLYAKWIENPNDGTDQEEKKNVPEDLVTKKLENGSVVTYYSTIPFAGKKYSVQNFGSISVLYKGRAYKTEKIKVNKKKQKFQILKLRGADKTVNKDIKKATKGRKGLSYKVKAYYVSEKDRLEYKLSKKKQLKQLKIWLSGKKYKVRKAEYIYDPKKNKIIFKGKNLSGEYDGHNDLRTKK